MPLAALTDAGACVAAAPRRCSGTAHCIAVLRMQTWTQYRGEVGIVACFFVLRKAFQKALDDNLLDLLWFHFILRQRRSIGLTGRPHSVLKRALVREEPAGP